MKHKSIAPYTNPSGPGDYEIGSTIGSKSVLSSNMKKSPGYSFQQKTKLPFFPGFEIEYKGLNTPALSKYSPNHKMIHDASSEWSTPLDPRFKGKTAAENKIVAKV